MSSRTRSAPRSSWIRRSTARLFALAALVLVTLWGGLESQARLRPYYLVRGTSFGQVKPRVLFVLDTSGSMSWRPGKTGCAAANLNTNGQCDCTWTECEGTNGVTASRIAGARQAIQSVVKSIGGGADFALMSFGSLAPPASVLQIPAKCSLTARFRWITEESAYASRQNAYGPWGNGVPPGQTVAQRGLWALCGSNRPFPYLRSDQLGFTLPAAPSFDPTNLPTGPLAKLYSDWTKFSASSMATRKVQWLPQFMGNHFKVECASPPTGSPLALSQGDYSTGELCGEDFYYVPYVDGWSGYASMQGYNSAAGTRERLGVDERATGGAACVKTVDPCCEDYCRNSQAFITCTNNCTASGTPPAPPPPAACNYHYDFTGLGCDTPPGGCPVCTSTWVDDLDPDPPSTTGWWCSCRVGTTTIPPFPNSSLYCTGSGSGTNCISTCETTCKYNNFCDFFGCRKCMDTNCMKSCVLLCGGNTCQDQCEVNVEACRPSCPLANRCPQCEEWSGVGGNATLLAPFFSQWAIDTYSGTDEGPATPDAANAVVAGLTGDGSNGGIGSQGGTPWASAIGDIPSTPSSASNAPFTHSTVASYLKLIADSDPTGLCTPLSAVLITDGNPEPASTEGGATLHGRLRALRTDLGIKTYVVGFALSSSSLNYMACAAAGSSNTSLPCTGTPTDAWDTCSNPSSPTTACAFLASDPTQLKNVLSGIVQQNLSIELPAGQGTTINEFKKAADGSKLIATQSGVSGFTEYPEWEGHVVRETCATGTFCAAAAMTATEAGEDEQFDDCTDPAVCDCNAFSRQWDAGTCLQQMAWSKRRLYTYSESAGVKTLVRIIDGSGAATTAFKTLLDDSTLGLPTLNATAKQAFAEFLAGKSWPADWKLPGLGTSVPVVVRRVPKYSNETNPKVPIRDPHCSGRPSPDGTGEVPPTLKTFSDAAWATKASGSGYGDHFEYQEAVLVGSDIGFLHAFQLNSGNEIFAFMPKFLLASAYQQSLKGPPVGSGDGLDSKRYGISATVNHGWVYDATATKWRHLALVGMGAGGTEYMALDVSHMGKLATDQPLEILWTTEDSTLKSFYDARLGETWSRPALTYQLSPVTSITTEPTAYVLMASGYPKVAPTVTEPRGRALIYANALTGVSISNVKVPMPPASELFDPEASEVTDPAVGTHCFSSFWGEMAEVYVTDPAGGLYRWDPALAGQSDSDYGATPTAWTTDAKLAHRFDACLDNGSGGCDVAPGNKWEVFDFSPAVVSPNRIGAPSPTADADQFLIAMVSGSPTDDKIDGGDASNKFHSSLYFLVDDHRSNKHKGITVPSGTPKNRLVSGVITAPDGTSAPAAGYVRLALSDIERTRTFKPYPTATTQVETRNFSRAARPIRPPRILVLPVGTAATEGAFVTEDITTEIVLVEFVVYEPGSRECNTLWHDAVNDVWYADPGETYSLVFALASKGGFNLGSGTPGTFTLPGSGTPISFDGGRLRMLTAPQQLGDGNCAGGGCGAQIPTPFQPPCAGGGSGLGGGSAYGIPLHTSQIEGFTPIEAP